MFLFTRPKYKQYILIWNMLKSYELFYELAYSLCTNTQSLNAPVFFCCSYNLIFSPRTSERRIDSRRRSICQPPAPFSGSCITNAVGFDIISIFFFCGGSLSVGANFGWQNWVGCFGYPRWTEMHVASSCLLHSKIDALVQIPWYRLSILIGLAGCAEVWRRHGVAINGEVQERNKLEDIVNCERFWL